MHEQYTAEQTFNIGERIKSDAELLRWGAEINPSAVLILPEELVRQIYVDEILQPGVPEFSQSREGQLVGEHRSELTFIRSGIHGSLGHKVDGREYSEFTRRGGFKGFRSYVSSNGLDILLPDEDQVRYPSHFRDDDTKTVLSEAASRVDTYLYQLRELELELIEFPRFRLGSMVTVKRNASHDHPSYLESDWTISKITADGRLVVTKPGLKKTVSFSSLLDWEKEASTK